MVIAKNIAGYFQSADVYSTCTNITFSHATTGNITKFLVARSLTHATRINSIKISTSAVLTGAAKISFAIVKQDIDTENGTILIPDYTGAPIPVPAADKVTENVDLGAHFGSTLGVILDKMGWETTKQLDIFMILDAAVTNSGEVGITVEVQYSPTTQLGTYTTGKTVPADSIKAAT